MHKKYGILAGIAATAALLNVAASGRVLADPQKETGGLASASSYEMERQTITYSGQILFRIRTGVAGYTAEQRADAVRERLGPILAMHNLVPKNVTVQQEKPYGDANIYVRDRLLITVDKSLAQANGNNDPGDLARQWADRMRSILPTVSVKQSADIPQSKN